MRTDSGTIRRISPETIMLYAKWIHVPEKYIAASVPTKSGIDHGNFKVVRPARVIRFDYSHKEHTFSKPSSKTISADIVGFRGDKQMIMEICFTHAVDEAKQAFLRQLGLRAIEIVFSVFDLDAGFDDVRKRVLEDTMYTVWRVHPGEEEARAALLAEITEEATRLDTEFDAKLAREERLRRVREDKIEAAEHERQAALKRYAKKLNKS